MIICRGQRSDLTNVAQDMYAEAARRRFYWFGSSAGVAISNMYPESGSVRQWLRHAWSIPVAYVVGFFIMLGPLKWHANAPHDAGSEAVSKTSPRDGRHREGDNAETTPARGINSYPLVGLHVG